MARPYRSRSEQAALLLWTVHGGSLAVAAAGPQKKQHMYALETTKGGATIFDEGRKAGWVYLCLTEEVRGGIRCGQADRFAVCLVQDSLANAARDLKPGDDDNSSAQLSLSASWP